MKKTLALLAALMLLLAPALAAAEVVATSFYPIYIFALNLTDGLEGVEVRNLAGADTGCLHDYQLQMGDLQTLAEADVLLVNGAGMEGYLDTVLMNFPSLPVVDASRGLELLCADGHEHEDGHEHTEWNAHVWLDVRNARLMVENLAQGLMDAMPAHAEAIARNRDAYLARLDALHAELLADAEGFARRTIVTFHEAFPYFARAYGLEVAAVVAREPDDPIVPSELAELIDLVTALGCPPLFTEPQYGDLAAQTLSQQTGAPIYTLDPIVTGPDRDVPLTYYEDVMRSNMDELLRALCDAKEEQVP